MRVNWARGIWEMAPSIGWDREHRFCNPFAKGAMKQRMRNLGRILVLRYGGDQLIDRPQECVEVLVEQGVQMEAKFDDAGFHGIAPRPNSRLLLCKVNGVSGFFHKEGFI